MQIVNRSKVLILPLRNVENGINFTTSIFTSTALFLLFVENMPMDSSKCENFEKKSREKIVISLAEYVILM